MMGVLKYPGRWFPAGCKCLPGSHVAERKASLAVHCRPGGHAFAVRIELSHLMNRSMPKRSHLVRPLACCWARHQRTAGTDTCNLQGQTLASKAGARCCMD
jgi:hypothetical protein